MKIPKVRFETSLSLTLVLALVTVFSLSSFAASSTTVDKEDEFVEDLAIMQELSGTLTAHDPVTINGVEAKTGATVLNGSVISTGTGGHASIELGPLGRVVLESLTTITLVMSDKGIEVTLNKCGSVALTIPAGLSGLVKIIHKQDVGVFSERKEVDIKAIQGQVLVKLEGDKEKILKEGEDDEFDDAFEASATGDALFKVYCHEDHVPFLYFFPLAGLLFLGAGGEEGSTPSQPPPVLSPIAP